MFGRTAVGWAGKGEPSKSTSVAETPSKIKEIHRIDRIFLSWKRGNRPRRSNHRIAFGLSELFADIPVF